MHYFGHIHRCAHCSTVFMRIIIFRIIITFCFIIIITGPGVLAVISPGVWSRAEPVSAFGTYLRRDRCIRERADSWPLRSTANMQTASSAEKQWFFVRPRRRHGMNELNRYWYGVDAQTLTFQQKLFRPRTGWRRYSSVLRHQCIVGDSRRLNREKERTKWFNVRFYFWPDFSSSFRPLSLSPFPSSFPLPFFFFSFFLQPLLFFLFLAVPFL